MTTTRAGTSMALGAMLCVELGAAASVGLADRLGSSGVVWLRLVCAGVILAAVVRPWRAPFERGAVATCVALGVMTAGMNLLFMAAIVRIPLGTASALEFLGPLTLAVVRGRGTGPLWALVAAAGVAALTEPWRGELDAVGVALALAAGVGWAAYIVLTQRAGDHLAGLRALALSMPVAAVVATVAAGPSVVGRLDWELVLAGLGLAVLMPLIPFSLELLALRRLPAAAFATLMSLEPAIALVIGIVALGQTPQPGAVLGIALVVAAGVGVVRAGCSRACDVAPAGAW